MAENRYIDRSWRTAVESSDDCLSITELERFAAGTVPVEMKGADHLRKCPRCLTELAMLKSFESTRPAPDEGAAVAWIAAHLERNMPGATRQGVAKAPAASSWRSFFRIPYVIATTAVAMIVIFSVSLYISEHSQEPQLSARVERPEIVRSGMVHPLAPSGDLDKVPNTLNWEAYPGAKSYSVELLEVDGNRLWSGKSEENSLQLQPAVKAMMHPQKTLRWRVTAMDEAGKVMAKSSEVSFRVTGPPK